MPKPNWSKSTRTFSLTKTPNPNTQTETDAFVVYSGYCSSPKKVTFHAGWKTYSHLWSALRYGSSRTRNDNYIQYVKNLKTGETVWRSWIDKNPYQF